MSERVGASPGGGGFAYATGGRVVVAKTPSMFIGGTGKAATSRLRSNADVRYAEAALNKRVSQLMPANSNSASLKAPRKSDISDIAARQKIALSFYRLTGMNPLSNKSHVRAIDFSRPVEVIVLKAGTRVDQHQELGKSVGRYFAPKGTSASTLGIRAEGRKKDSYVLTRDQFVLKSIAADTRQRDDLGSSLRGGGGGVQYFAVSTDAFQLIED